MPPEIIECVPNVSTADPRILRELVAAASRPPECRVIDAQDFTAEPVARIKIPSRVPFGFHAAWVPA